MGTRHLYWILTGPSFAVQDSDDQTHWLWETSTIVTLDSQATLITTSLPFLTVRNYDRPHWRHPFQISLSFFLKVRKELWSSIWMDSFQIPSFLTVWNCVRHPGCLPSKFPFPFLIVGNCDYHRGCVPAKFPSFFNSVWDCDRHPGYIPSIFVRHFLTVWYWDHTLSHFLSFFNSVKLWSPPWIHPFKLPVLFLTVWYWDHTLSHFPSFFNSVKLWSPRWIHPFKLSRPLPNSVVLRSHPFTFPLLF